MAIEGFISRNRRLEEHAFEYEDFKPEKLLRLTDAEVFYLLAYNLATMFCSKNTRFDAASILGVSAFCLHGEGSDLSNADLQRSIYKSSRNYLERKNALFTSIQAADIGIEYERTGTRSFTLRMGDRDRFIESVSFGTLMRSLKYPGFPEILKSGALFEGIKSIISEDTLRSIEDTLMDYYPKDSVRQKRINIIRALSLGYLSAPELRRSIFELFASSRDNVEQIIADIMDEYEPEIKPRIGRIRVSTRESIKKYKLILVNK